MDWTKLLTNINLLAQIVGTVLVAVYVIYTYRTFAQIKKQTDYQQDAFLRMDSSVVSSLEESHDQSGSARSVSGRLLIASRSRRYNLNYVQKDLSVRLKGILRPIFSNFDANIFEGNYFTLTFTNYGNAEVNSIQLDITVVIRNSDELVREKMLKPVETTNSCVNIKEVVGRNGGSITVPLISTAAFPSYEIRVKGRYTDIRNKSYDLTSVLDKGENAHFHKLPSK